jgi:hypothetical protein
MSGSTNPLRSNPAVAISRERVGSGMLGQRLAIYAVARARHHLDDPLTTLGLPLIEELLFTAAERPVAATAITSGGPARLEHWSILLTLESGLCATIDLGAGYGVAQPGELDLRVEWSGTEGVVLVDPPAVAVTISTAHGHHRESAEIEPVALALFAFAERAREIFADPPLDWRTAVNVTAAIRESAETNARVLIPT